MSNYQDGSWDTKYGTITARNPGRKSPPPNLQTMRRPVGDVTLQGPALRSFRDAEKKATPRRMRRKGKIQPILLTGVGYRSYDYQADLYRRDSSGRYADPDGSLHVEALAVDIDTRQSALRQARIKKALKDCGWHYAVSGEPWHASFHLSG